MYDFHTHTFLSDGVLSPIELIRRALVRGYRAMALTDHVGLGNVEYVVKTLVVDCEQATRRWDILALPGVEITHVPKDDIDLVARTAKEMGAKLVAVHGKRQWSPWNLVPTRRHCVQTSWMYWHILGSLRMRKPGWPRSGAST